MKRLLILLLAATALGAAAKTEGERNLIAVSGRVTCSQDRSPLGGASVEVLHAGESALCNKRGRYSVRAGAGDTLRFSFRGCISRDVPVAGRTEIDVELVPQEVGGAAAAAGSAEDSFGANGAPHSVSPIREEPVGDPGSDGAGIAGSGAGAEPVVVGGRISAGADGSPVVGAVVRTSSGREASSDADGRYEIAAERTDTLRLFVADRLLRRIPVAGRTRIDVLLESDRVEEERIAGCGGSEEVSCAETVSDASFGMLIQAFYMPSKHTEEYACYPENRFRSAIDEPLSTFSLESDGASYANCRRILTSGREPEPDAVRIEEFLNYFTYDYPEPRRNDPFSLTAETGPCPWSAAHRLVRIGLRACEVDAREIPPSNFVYLIDVSGSMHDQLPLVKASMKMLTDNLRAEDRVSIVTYSTEVRTVLSSVPGDERRRIKDAIDELAARGGTAGGAGLETAYEVAVRNFIPQGNNRIILCSDGDFNVGSSSDEEIGSLIERKRKQTGVLLSVLGYGMGNYKDRKMQLMAEKGDGNYAYIDDMKEADKVLFHEFGATAWAVAQDVKMQVEFNPAHVASYRLVGYESRLLEAQDFNDDAKDAGEIGAGHCVTALYEIIPVGTEKHPAGSIDGLKYQSRQGAPVVTIPSSELLTAKVRYKLPGSSRSRLMKISLAESGSEELTGDFAFAAAVAMYGQLLKMSDFRGDATYEAVENLAARGLDNDPEGYRHEFVDLVRITRHVVRDFAPVKGPGQDSGAE